MALWLIRAGKYGEHEQRFFANHCVYLTWEDLATNDLSTAKNYADIKTIVRAAYPDAPERRLGNFSGQIWAFALEMKVGDWIALPLKTKSAIAIGEITSAYEYDATGEPLFRHKLQIKWLNIEIPRTAFDQDLLYSFGAAMTICKIERNDAEKRVRAMARANWNGAVASALPNESPESSEADSRINLELLARDQIARLIIRKFKGHGMARLVEAVLQAQGYTTHLSPEGPDKGIDILAAAGALGFERPRICVQVKSGDSPVDLPTLNQLIGAMQNVHADQGLLVSWGGFKSSVLKESPTQFFRVRLWDQDDLIRELLANYDKLDDEIKAELPLKRIWTVTAQNDEE